MGRICDQFPPKIIIHDLTSVAVHIPPEYLEQKGILYHVVKQLNYFGVNIMEMYTTQSELSILIRKEDLNATMNILG